MRGHLHDRLAVGSQGLVAGQVLEQEALDDLECNEEERSGQTGHGTDERRVEKHATQVPQLELRNCGRAQAQDAETTGAFCAFWKRHRE